MNRLSIVGLSGLGLAAALAGPPAAAAEPTPFQLFQTYCVAHAAQPEAVQAAATAAGLLTAPRSAPAADGTAMTIQMKIVGEEVVHAVITGVGPSSVAEGLPSAQARLCTISAPNGGADTLQDARSWLGVAPSGGSDGFTLYDYRQAASGPRALASTDVAGKSEALRAGELRRLVVKRVDGLASVSWVVFSAR